MAAIDPFLRRVQILRWLHNSNGKPTTVREMIEHLKRERFLEDQSDNAQLKTVQRDLIELSEQKNPDNQLGLCWAKGEANEIKWWIEEPGQLDFEVTKIAPDDLLTTFQLAKKHLVNVMPPYAYAALGRYFESSERQINDRLKNSTRNIPRLVARIHVDQRGQRLHEPRAVDENILNCLFDALEQNKQLQITYRGKQHRLHPAGIIVKPPKTYLLAKHHKYQDQDFTPYLVHRIDAAKRMTLTANIPSNFNLQKYVLDGNSDTALFKGDKQDYEVVLRLHLANSGNLLNDLKEHPPFRQQQFSEENNTTCKFSFQSKLTTQLEEWILGRSGFVEVLGPNSLRQHIKKTIFAMASLY